MSQALRLELYAMASFAIPVSWYNFVDYYPLVTKTTVATKTGTKTNVFLKDPRGSLDGELDGWASELFNENPNYTTCCMQMSHAINMAFVNRDVSKLIGTRSVRGRLTHSATIARAGNKEFHYLASVDEMKGFLDRTFEPGRKISSRKDIEDQPGIVVFMGTAQSGIHTEIWIGDNFHQTFMKNNFASLGWPNTWFWSLGDPTLVDI
jgi:hypothetical protein